jgi:hypothetical protein
MLMFYLMEERTKLQKLINIGKDLKLQLRKDQQSSVQKHQQS